MGKRTVRNSKKSLIALLVYGSTQLQGLNIANAVSLRNTITHGIAGVVPQPTVDHKKEIKQTNPDFASTMTLNHWKLYNSDETLDMYQKAEYMVHK